MADELPVVSLVSGRHHPRQPELTVFVNWPWSPSGLLFVDLVKRTIPARERAFDPGEKHVGGRPKGWWTSDRARPAMMKLLRDRFRMVKVIDNDETYIVDQNGEIHEDVQPRLI
jgi:hypothetical protein